MAEVEAAAAHVLVHVLVLAAHVLVQVVGGKAYQLWIYFRT